MGIFTKAFGGVESDERNNTLGVKVEKLLDQEKYPWSIPEESVNGGEPTHRRIDKDGSVHEYGDLDYHIDRLVIVPDVSGERSFRAEGDESTLRAFAQEGYDTAQELSVNGSVHDRGKLSVTIDHLLVM